MVAVGTWEIETLLSCFGIIGSRQSPRHSRRTKLACVTVDRLLTVWGRALKDNCRSTLKRYRRGQPLPLAVSVAGFNVRGTATPTSFAWKERELTELHQLL